MKLADLSSLIGYKVFKFWNLKITKKEGKIGVSFFINQRNENTITHFIEISNDRFFQIASELTINNGYIAKNMTFLEDNEGKIDLYPFDSEEVKEVLKDIIIKRKELQIGSIVEVIDTNYMDIVNNKKLCYLGEIYSNYNKNKKEFLFVRINPKTLKFNTSEYNCMEKMKTFPKIIEAQPVLSNEQILEIVSKLKEKYTILSIYKYNFNS